MSVLLPKRRGCDLDLEVCQTLYPFEIMKKINLCHTVAILLHITIDGTTISVNAVPLLPAETRIAASHPAVWEEQVRPLWLPRGLMPRDQHALTRLELPPCLSY